MLPLFDPTGDSPKGPFMPPELFHSSLLNDKQIRERCEQEGMIEPFLPEQVRVRPAGEETVFSFAKGQTVREAITKAMSYGMSTCGYDIRATTSWKLLHPQYLNPDAVIDPKRPDPTIWKNVDADVLTLPPHGFCLGRSVEYFRMPRDVVAICLGKSTYARNGILPLMTPLEPGWEGHLTLEFANLTPLPARIYAEEGIAQVLFFRIDNPNTSYNDRPSKYQKQGPGIVIGEV